MPAFVQKKIIRFQHCDPAGLIFYPRVFELGGEVIEDWFIEWSGYTPHAYHAIEHLSLPTVKICCEFFDQVRLSDEITFTLVVNNVGRSSIALSIEASRNNDLCFRINSNLVQVAKGADGRYRAHPFSDEVRQRLLGYMSAPSPSSGISEPSKNAG
jgi:4-hydroxybenzoyl-CoA thioesterase